MPGPQPTSSTRRTSPQVVMRKDGRKLLLNEQSLPRRYARLCSMTRPVSVMALPAQLTKTPGQGRRGKRTALEGHHLHPQSKLAGP